MSKYHQLNTLYDWDQVLSGLEDNRIMLLNKAKDDYIMAWGVKSELDISKGNYQAKILQTFVESHYGYYIFGILSYDIKNAATRNLSAKEKGIESDDISFFVPEHVLIRRKSEFVYFGNENLPDFEKMLNKIVKKNCYLNKTEKLKLQQLTNRKEYIDNLHRIKKAIQRGDIYEMNYCISFESDFNDINVFQTYNELAKIANAPFSSFVKMNSQVILSASPERFIRRDRNRLISQPIKGTARRGETFDEDKKISEALVNNQKEISENVMIVDLVRNDLSRIAEKKSVEVTELCGVYTFQTVHQLISTIQCEIDPKKKFSDILEALFPMGSMTGAPKISAIKHIDKFENFNRGIYSGSIGYIEPNGNFDFNVVIRTILADLNENKLSASVGGAITIKSDPEQEYEECLLKLRALEKVLC